MREVEPRPWERARDEAGRLREELAGRSDAWCSFCRRNHREVGPLAEGPGFVYICYRCVRLSGELIEQECRERGIPLPDPPADS